MPKIKTQCPFCQTEVHVYSEWEGQTAGCRACGNSFTITFQETDAGENPQERSSGRNHIVRCPACQAVHSVSENGRKTQQRSCSKCGQTFMFSLEMTFRCAVKLDPAEDGTPRIACPYCGRHYVLNYTPKQGLIGCQECMNIFAEPEADPAADAAGDAPKPKIVFGKVPQAFVLPIKNDWE